MIEPCGEVHPDLPIACEHRESANLHDEHMGFHEGVLVEWANESYPAKKVSSSPRTNAERILQAADRVRERERKPLSDPDENTVGKFPASGPDTSIGSAMAILPKTGTQRRDVLDAIAEAGVDGMTDEEIQAVLKMNPSSQRPRRGELVDGGWIIDSGRRRKTPAGLDAIVWVLDFRRAVQDALRAT